ncbi:MAG: Biosynthetic peptidoglycan transglycosylase [Hydrocarboniphaga sp.]|uniref:monofunctional biosynthetic peptidoglycan transglycosylase n=1 Tax=Hydrocarboniphaga sp. TaxID=2033016 RepID=UPI00261B4AE3|nr:monofunctional biosynthetic peptidoglycan transglycosylase [Hydrocarboniphaga sp.]MDB5969287.1 Biosynthetic peptidoglycan transglycosylase [Hydrocarboniphaga sp.]
MPTPPPDQIRVPNRRSRHDIPPDPPKKEADLARPRRRTSHVRRLLLALVCLFVVLPLTLILLGRFVPIAVTSYMLQSPTRPVQHQWVSRTRIAESARRAVIAAEDQKFWDHHGFDVEAMQKAYARNQRGGRVRGGSTISQQTAKNLFLWPGGGYLRKGIEAGITVAIETLWGKDRILEVYLNSAEFGSGIYGVEAASQHFFGKPAAQLTPAEAARLAAVLPNPRKWSVSSPGSYVQSRAAWIQRQMGYSGRRPPVEDAEPAPPPGEVIPDDDEDPPAFAPSPAAEPAPTRPEPDPEPAAEPPASSDAPKAEPLSEPELDAPQPVPLTPATH